MPPGPIEELLVADHRRLEALLLRAVAGTEIDRPAFEEFRAGLLRHIGIEEKILLREARKLGDVPHAIELRVQHGAIASLLVPTPTHDIVAELRGLLAAHNPLEEGDAGLYAVCDRLLAPRIAEILERIRAAPEIPLAPHFDGEGAHRTAASALEASRKIKRS